MPRPTASVCPSRLRRTGLAAVSALAITAFGALSNPGLSAAESAGPAAPVSGSLDQLAFSYIGSSTTPQGIQGYLGGLFDPTGQLPGTNPARCSPSPAHPRPVVLVHGFTSNSQQNWADLAPILAEDGYCVFTVDYGKLSDLPVLGSFGGLTPMYSAIAELGEVVDHALAVTGADRVDLIGHSMGTGVASGYVKLAGGAEKVGTVINLAGVMGGQANPLPQVLPDSGSLVGGADLLQGSSFLDRLNAGGSPYVPGVRYVNIVSTTDGTIQPYQSGLAKPLPGEDAQNIVLQDVCPGERTIHGRMASAPAPVALLRNALDPAAALPISCGAM